MARKLLFALLIFLLVVTGAGYAYAAENPSEGKDVINEVFDYLIKYHKDNPKTKQLVEGAIWGMIDTLDDPYTVYLTDQEVKQFVDDISGGYSGVGLYLEGQPDYPRVSGVLSRSPALETGIKAGDIIKKVDGTDIKGLPLKQVVEKIKGPPGTEVELGIERDGRDITFKLIRADLNAVTTESKVLGNNTGYIAVRSFGFKTPEEFGSALKRLAALKVSGLIIDLRDNPGGFLNSAIDMASNFLKQGDLIVSTRDYNGSVKKYSAPMDVKTVRMPMVILVNSRSASSSEIFAGALQDYGVAALVGETSYGKGVVQSLIPLETGGALKVTTAEYSTPKGRHLQKQGLKPDFSVTNPDLQVLFALKLLHPEHKRMITFTTGSDEVNIDGEKILLEDSMINNEGTLCLPLRFTFEAMGYVVSWDNDGGKIILQKLGNSIVIPVKGYPLINGQEIKTNKNIYMKDSVSYIPIGMLKDLGIKADPQNDRIVLED
ncbi:MAG: hypothetical protein VR68_11955 [Peptococcaceae bacterium BRH_c4a]|nr:MAG: hypothetical protein VR68_11955 [Peptococcaceae bacterium BRH_c4a]